MKPFLLLRTRSKDSRDETEIRRYRVRTRERLEIAGTTGSGLPERTREGERSPECTGRHPIVHGRLDVQENGFSRRNRRVLEAKIRSIILGIAEEADVPA